MHFGAGVRFDVDTHALVVVLGAICGPIRETRAVRIAGLDEVHEIPLQHFGDFTTIYGSLGAAMALLVWMYMISLVVLVGAEFNALLFPRAMLGKELTAINGAKS